jgi:DNA-binding NarL/FixJ family response regulator
MEFSGIRRCGYPHRPQALPVLALLFRSATIEPVGQRVLIVDDHAGFRASARRMLECEGYDVVGEVEDGASALAAAQELSPDLVLLDVNLPDGDGRDIAGRLCEEAGVAVLLISSRDDIDGEAPAIGFIPKDRLSGSSIAEALD